MTRDHDDQTGAESEQLPDYDTKNPFEKETRQQPAFSGFDEDDDDVYEEPDRDTDYASGFQDDELIDDEVEGTLPDDDSDEEFESFYTQPSSSESDTDAWGDLAIDEQAESEEWFDDNDYSEDQGGDRPSLPPTLIAVAVIALLLLGAGGYGVMQQRDDTQEEIRQLRAALATTADPEEVITSRAALQEMTQRNDQLQSEMTTLTLENRRLTDTVAGLEAQLHVQLTATTKPAKATSPIPSPAPVEPSAAPVKPAPVKPAAAPVEASAVSSKPTVPAPASPRSQAGSKKMVSAPPQGDWFVNFGSYGQRAAAEKWQGKLQPAAGSVIVAESIKEGRTYHRVRVIGLNDRDAAEKVANALEKQYGLSELWVGRQ